MVATHGRPMLKSTVEASDTVDILYRNEPVPQSNEYQAQLPHVTIPGLSIHKVSREGAEERIDTVQAGISHVIAGSLESNYPPYGPSTDAKPLTNRLPYFFEQGFRFRG